MRYHNVARSIGGEVVFYLAIIRLLPIILLLSMVLVLLLGRHLGIRLTRESGMKGGGAAEGAVFALLGLLIAFTFSGAAQRFDLRRAQIVEEANNIGTAWLRIDLLPEADQPRMRKLFRDYVDARLRVHTSLPDLETTNKELALTTTLQNEMWKNAVLACKKDTSSQTSMLVLSAFNEMIDISTTRVMTAQFHPPVVIYLLLIFLALFSSLLAGFNMVDKKRSWLHILGFAAAMTFSVYTILDLEFPRIGLLRIDAADKVLIDLRNSMNP